MKEIVLWGCGNIGGSAYESLKKSYKIRAYGDNDKYKQGLIYKGVPVIGFDELIQNYKDCYIILTMTNYYEEAKKLYDSQMKVLGYWDPITNKILPWKRIGWEDLKRMKKVQLYAGDIYENFDKYSDDYVICLSLTNKNYRCIQHNIEFPYPLEDNSVDSYQIEDVIEHIEKEKVVRILNEIYRILKVGGYLRLSLPDYHSPLVLHNSFVDRDGNVIYDPTGGGKFELGKVSDGGHMWFPTYELVQEILEKTKFKSLIYYRYYDCYGKKYEKDIDYKKGYISRTKENNTIKEDKSIIVDCYK